jgi:hypothetical protein
VHVCGASVSSMRAENTKGPAVMRSIVITGCSHPAKFPITMLLVMAVIMDRGS